MKILVIALFCSQVSYIGISCHQPTSSLISENEKQKFIDSFKLDQQLKLDSIDKAVLFDTAGMSYAPIKIIKAEILPGGYSRVVRIKYKNRTNKDISALRFKWYGLNAFNEPADLGSSYTKGFGGGFTDDILKAGSSTETDWRIGNNDGKKLVLAWPYEVAFSDGSKWKLYNK
jgi:hypothetical protein